MVPCFCSRGCQRLFPTLPALGTLAKLKQSFRVTTGISLSTAQWQPNIVKTNMNRQLAHFASCFLHPARSVYMTCQTRQAHHRFLAPLHNFAVTPSPDLVRAPFYRPPPLPGPSTLPSPLEYPGNDCIWTILSVRQSSTQIALRAKVDGAKGHS